MTDYVTKQVDGATVVALSIPPFSIPARRLLSQLAFLNRFTDAEAIAIDLASIGATEAAATLRRYIKKVDAAAYIDLDLAELRSGVQALEAAGLLDTGRAAEILDAPITADERPL